MGIMLVDNKYIQTITGIVVALWILFSSLSTFYEFLRQRQDKLTALRHAPFGFYGMTLAHIGIAITIVGITVTTQHSVDLHKRMVVGEQVEFAGHVFLLEAIKTIPGPNYTATEAVVKVSKDNKHITTLRSQKRTYFAREMPMTEAGIDWGMIRDLYVSLGEPLGDGAWSLRLYHKPFIRWIWFGAIFMTLGGLLSTADRRYRIEDAKRSHGQAEASLAGAAVNR
jgi:cytochrome c-type biogenesis protein CcmF